MSVLQSKYRIFSLSQGKIVAEASSLREIKVAFQESLKNSDDVCVLDHNLETYARFLGGKVMPGQHYRKFTQRGVAVKPKEVRPAAAPAPKFNPMITYLDYSRAQEKWAEENNVNVGDMVIVRDKAGDYEKGWQNSWATDMDKAIGNQYEVVEIRGATGIRLKDGLCTWEKGFEYPFYVLEKVEETPVQKVARDVIAQIDARKLIGDTGVVIGRNSCHSLEGFGTHTPAQEVLTGPSAPTCETCAKGGIFLSYIRVFNEHTIGDLIEQRYNADLKLDRKDNGLMAKIVKDFGATLLHEIEVAFERQRMDWTPKDISDERCAELFERYSSVSHRATDRMRAIMVDVYNGTF
jgi:hypothetical protein